DSLMKTNQFKSRTRRRPEPRVPRRAQLAVEFLESRLVLSHTNTPVSAPVLLLKTLPGGPGPQGGLTTYAQPTPAYTGASLNTPITAPDLTTVSSLADATETVGIAPASQARTVGSTWATWGSPPDTESAFPRLIFVSASSVTLTLATPAATFGVEVEPNDFGV